MSVQRFHDAFSLDSARRRFLFKDDFLGDVLQDLWTVSSSGGGTAVVVDAQTGGIVRLSSSAVAGVFTKIEWNDIRSLLVSKQVIMEVRAKIPTITNINCAPCRIRFDASNSIRFFLDDNVSPNWLLDTEDGGVRTRTNSGVVADTDYHTFRIETFDTPSVDFYIDDVLVGTHTTNIPDDAADYLHPDLLVQTIGEAVAKTMDVDYVVISQER